MANIEQGNAFLELKQRTNRDVRQLGPIVGQSYGPVESTAGQTTINLSFAVEQTDTAKKQVQLFVDGKLLSEGAGNDYTYIGAVNGQSSQVQLSAPLAAGLNIFAQRVGVSIQNFPSPATVQATLNTDVAQPNLMAKAGFSNFIAPAYIAAANTTIVNRAQVLDDSATLKSIAGHEKIMVRALSLLQSESGPTGEQVYEIQSKDSRIRFAGVWQLNAFPTGSGEGVNASSSTAGAFVEVVFYGTDLNLLIEAASTGKDLRASIDGGAEGSNLYTQTVASNLNNRGYNLNQQLTVASGLTLGWHTVKIRVVTSSTFIYGFEIFNNRTTLAILPGTAYAGAEREILSAISSSSFSAGVAGVRGARIVKYINDGAISQAVQEVNGAVAYYTSADHTNEEPLRKLNFREFGNGRADDFQTLAGVSSDRAFTLEDNCTTLNATAVTAPGDAIRLLNNTTSIVAITFVGTGLDVWWYGDAAGTNGSASAYTTVVDGVSAGNWDTTVVAADVSVPKLKKIVSGLPYGTHTVRITRNTANVWTLHLLDFVIYQPKKPAIPSGAIEVADYNLVATFVPNTSAGTNPSSTISTGVIRHTNMRELSYVGTFTTGANSNFPSGFGEASTQANGNYIEYTFWGTGFDHRFIEQTARAAVVNMTLNGVALTTANFPTALTANTGNGVSMNLGTGVMDMQAGSSVGLGGISVYNLPLNKYVLRMTKGDAAATVLETTLDIITPIHVIHPSFKVNNSVQSNRQLSPEKSTVNNTPDLGKAKAWVYFDGVNQRIVSSFNISAVLVAATGRYTVYFEKPFKADNYVIAALGEATQMEMDRTPLVANASSNAWCSLFTSGSTGTQVTTNFCAVFFGELVDE